MIADVTVLCCGVNLAHPTIIVLSRGGVILTLCELQHGVVGFMVQERGVSFGVVVLMCRTALPGGNCPQNCFLSLDPKHLNEVTVQLVM